MALPEADLLAEVRGALNLLTLGRGDYSTARRARSLVDHFRQTGEVADALRTVRPSPRDVTPPGHEYHTCRSCGMRTCEVCDSLIRVHSTDGDLNWERHILTQKHYRALRKFYG